MNQAPMIRDGKTITPHTSTVLDKVLHSSRTLWLVCVNLYRYTFQQTPTTCEDFANFGARNEQISPHINADNTGTDTCRRRRRINWYSDTLR